MTVWFGLLWCMLVFCCGFELELFALRLVLVIYLDYCFIDVFWFCVDFVLFAVLACLSDWCGCWW